MCKVLLSFIFNATLLYTYTRFVRTTLYNNSAIHEHAFAVRVCLQNYHGFTLSISWMSHVNIIGVDIKSQFLIIISVNVWLVNYYWLCKPTHSCVNLFMCWHSFTRIQLCLYWTMIRAFRWIARTIRLYHIRSPYTS